MSELAHIDFEGKRLEIVDETARKHVNKLTEGKVGYPDYMNRSTLFSGSANSARNAVITIEKDGFVDFWYSLDTGYKGDGPHTVSGEIYINEMHLCDFAAVCYGETIYNSTPAYPVKAGDIITFSVSDNISVFNCHCWPLHSTGESGGDLED